MNTPQQYDFLCSIGELIDKLCIELIKCAHANHAILDERKKEAPDHKRISSLEFLARSAGEQRVRLRNEINRRLAEGMARRGIGVAAEARTYELDDA